MAENVEQAVARLRGVLDSLAAAGPVIVRHDSLFAADLYALIAAYADAARDRERLDWLDTQREAVASYDGTEHIANVWGVYAQRRDVRAAIDEAIDAARTGEAR